MGRVKLHDWQPHKRITEHGIDTLRVGESISIPVADRAEVVKIQAQVGEFNRWKGDTKSRIITRHDGKWLHVRRSEYLHLQDSEAWQCGMWRTLTSNDQRELLIVLRSLNTAAQATGKPYRFRIRMMDGGAGYQKQLIGIRGPYKREPQYMRWHNAARQLRVGAEVLLEGATRDQVRRLVRNLEHLGRYSRKQARNGYTLRRVS